MWTLITGASSGLGLELARIFAEHRHDLILVARTAAKLDQLSSELRAKGVDVKTIALDLAQHGAADALVDQLNARQLEVDILVNNAGFGLHGKFLDNDDKEQLEMLQLNMVTPTRLTKLLLPAMVERRSGKVLNVASTAAFQAGPLMASYYATKAYLLHWSEAIALEYADQGITVTALCPGATATDFAARAGATNTPLFARNVLNAADVAKAGYDGLMAGKTVVIPGFRNNVLRLGTRLVPRRVAAQLARRIQEPQP
ncbi:MAG TPA: SDR family oxidoreductase [Bryobacteraceae bacterium]|nr:SDR family oxidoreductase [Bryobacteraceae bacterium]